MKETAKQEDVWGERITVTGSDARVCTFLFDEDMNQYMFEKFEVVPPRIVQLRHHIKHNEEQIRLHPETALQIRQEYITELFKLRKELADLIGNTSGDPVPQKKSKAFFPGLT